MDYRSLTEAAVEIAALVAKGLAEAYGTGMIRRDIKPAGEAGYKRLLRLWEDALGDLPELTDPASGFAHQQASELYSRWN